MRNLIFTIGNNELLKNRALLCQVKTKLTKFVTKLMAQVEKKLPYQNNNQIRLIKKDTVGSRWQISLRFEAVISNERQFVFSFFVFVYVFILQI